MTNEEIIGQAFYPHECGGMIECVTKQDALKSMNEARKDEAVAILEFLTGKYSPYAICYGSEIPFVTETEDLSIEKFYSIFKQQNEKQ